MGASAVSCGGSDDIDPTVCNTEVPVRTDWVTVFDGGMPINTGMSGLDVTSLSIGGTQVSDNFINRGNVEVYQSLAPSDPNSGVGQIVVQMRKFTFACSAEAAALSEDGNPSAFDRIQPWIFASNSVLPPFDADLEGLECTPETGFVDGCRIRVYYDGDTQPIRAGADIRVFLPADYNGKLRLETEDNIEDNSYKDRSDIIVTGLQGELEAYLDSGNAQVIVADDALPAPACGPENNAACEEYIDPATDMPSPWSSDCPCGVNNLNKINVSSRDSEAMNFTMDAPASYWMVATLNNADPTNTLVDNGFCDVNVDCNGFDSCEQDPVDCNDAERPWKCKAVTNAKSGAVVGSGVVVQVTSGQCADVEFHADPSQYGLDEEVEKRGILDVCTGCLDGVVTVPQP